MFELISLWRQHRRCRQGDHEWETDFVGSRSDAVSCLYCPAIGYRLKEAPTRG
jgi:hypothetical protein